MQHTGDGPCLRMSRALHGTCRSKSALAWYALGAQKFCCTIVPSNASRVRADQVCTVVLCPQMQKGLLMKHVGVEL